MLLSWLFLDTVNIVLMLITSFCAGADPLAAAAAAASGSPVASAAVPAALPHHFVPPGQEHPLVAMAQNYERMCAEMLSRPPYNSDAILAQQVRSRSRVASSLTF